MRNSCGMVVSLKKWSSGRTSFKVAAEDYPSI
jgi:hypothetical protein